MYLNLEEQNDGTIKALDQKLELVNYKPITEKAESIAHHHMLGEIVIEDGRRIRVTTKHIFILEDKLKYGWRQGKLGSVYRERRMSTVCEHRDEKRFLFGNYRVFVL